MKIKLLVYLFVGFLTISPNVVSAGILPSAETIFGKDLAEKIFGKKENKKENVDNSLGTEKQKKKIQILPSAETIFGKDLADKIFGKNDNQKVKRDDKVSKEQEKINKMIAKQYSNNDISFYTGQFDISDEIGDDKTNLIGFEHKNPNLLRETFLGKFSPITGAFLTGKGSSYLYTGVEGQYNIGPVKILPSFSPGYYQKGDGKDLGDVLEFKSEIKIGFDILENSKIGYSYSHISNNDWGDVNPGTDNQSITFSKRF